MSMSEPTDVILTLIPVILDDSKPADDNNWLDNDAAELIESTQPLPDEKVVEDAVHRCNALSFHITAAGVMLETQEGRVNVLDGEYIHCGEQCFRVQIEQKPHFQEAPIQAPAPTHSMALPISDDIWSSGEEVQHQTHIPDPFANRHQQAIAPATRPATATPVVNHHDPLNFLYDNHSSHSHDPNALLPSVPTEPRGIHAAPSHALSATPNYFAEPTGHHPIAPQAPASYPASSLTAIDSVPPQTGNVLNDLGIDATQSTITQKPHNAGKATFLDQSPVDMLDEYLSTEDEPYIRQPYMPEPHQATVAAQQPSSTVERSKGWFDGVKSAVKGLKKR